jgi:hypothetical protein
MQMYGGGGIAHTFLTSALDEGEWLAACPRGRNPGTHWIGGWVDPRAGLEVVSKRKILPCRESNPSSPTLILSLIIQNIILIKIKCKGVPLHAMEAHGGRGGIAPTHT